MEIEQTEEARRMVTTWACSEINHGVRAKPLIAAVAQFMADKTNAAVLHCYDHPFGWVVTIFHEGKVIHHAVGRAKSAEALLDVFIFEAQLAIETFGADKYGSFEPVK